MIESNFPMGTTWEGVDGKPSGFTPSAHRSTHAAGGADALSPADLGAVPTARKVNGKSLAGDISLSAADVGAAPVSHTHSASSITVDTLPLARGGTGAGTATAALKNLGGLPAAGGTMTGNLRLKGSGNYGNKLNFGDGEYVYLHESTDDNLDIKAKNINFLASGSLKLNGTAFNPVSSAIETGSYVGTGTYGSSNPTTLNFSFIPKAVYITANDMGGGYYHSLHIISGQGKGTVLRASGGYTGDVVITWSNTKVSWYTTGTDNRSQLNSSSQSYSYYALG